MVSEHDFPILEFDPSREALIEPSRLIPRHDVPRFCVICFFQDAIEALRSEGRLREAWRFRSEMADLPVYVVETGRGPVCLVQGFMGAAGAVALLEELIAGGNDTFLVCGGAGVLRKDMAVGHLIIPDVAVRDEGTSYHYAAPSREIACDEAVVERLASGLEKRGIPFLKGKTWTTDAFYRETRARVDKRVGEGCVTVEMEASALFAVAKFRDVSLGQILYGGDDLSGVEWDHRSWQKRGDIRRNLLELSLELAFELPLPAKNSPQ